MSEPLSSEKRGCRGCGENQFHSAECDLFEGVVIDRECSPERHRFIDSKDGLCNRVLDFPRVCDQPRDAEVHQVSEKKRPAVLTCPECPMGSPCLSECQFCEYIRAQAWHCNHEGLTSPHPPSLCGGCHHPKSDFNPTTGKCEHRYPDSITSHCWHACTFPAPVEAQVDFCYSPGDEGAEYCGDPKVRHCPVLGDAAFWDTPKAQEHLVNCLRYDHLIHHKFLATPVVEADAVAETCKWHTEPSSGNDCFTTSCGTVLYCEPPNIEEYDDAEFCCFCGKVISHE